MSKDFDPTQKRLDRPPVSLRMETTRHFTATVYVVNDGATLLHKHERLGLWLPPGGHIDRDELPHRAAIRETREETGLDIDLLHEPTGPTSSTARPLPQPVSILLEDINVTEHGVGHQHIDFIYFARTESRTLNPAAGEMPVDAWRWFDQSDLVTDDRFESDVVALGIDAIEAAG